jgi:hypothetical protein
LEWEPSITPKTTNSPFTNMCQSYFHKIGFWTYWIWNGTERVKNNQQSLHVSILSSIKKLQFKFLCSVLTSIRDNDIYVNSGNSPSQADDGNVVNVSKSWECYKLDSGSFLSCRSLTLQDKLKPRRILGPERDEVRKLHSEEFHNLYSSPLLHWLNQKDQMDTESRMHGSEVVTNVW